MENVLLTSGEDYVALEISKLPLDANSRAQALRGYAIAISVVNLVWKAWQHVRAGLGMKVDPLSQSSGAT